MDVQAVQLVPQLQASALYFRQKLAVHNFTLYNLSTNEVVCYVWHEGEGELNANVFTLCVVDYLVNEVGCTKNIVIYSDGCGSQNRNATLSNALSLLAKEKQITITQNYLEKGHTQMECDSVHSVIERKKKNRDIFVPVQYVQLIQDARTKSPYKVCYIDHTFFKRLQHNPRVCLNQARSQTRRSNCCWLAVFGIPTFGGNSLETSLHWRLERYWRLRQTSSRISNFSNKSSCRIITHFMTIWLTDC